MRLKVVTTLLSVAGLLLLALWPWLVGTRPPESAPRVEVARYGVKVLAYFGLTCSVFITAAVSALILARRTRRQYLDATRENLQELIEGTLRDHDRR